MKLIYTARDITEAHILSGMLKANAIEAYVGGQYLQGGVGELAAMDFATISVADEDIDAALTVIKEYDTSINSTITQGKNSYIVPLIVLLTSILMMILLAVLFGGYQ
jgi:hypothetical protein